MKKATPFGRKSRGLRVERDMLIGDLADRICTSASFISQIETGAKRIPDGYVDKLADVLQLSSEERAELLELALLSANEFKIGVRRDASDIDRQLAYEFSIAFARMSDEKKRMLLKSVKEG